jgi:predicted Ser/Thr protein kinase
LEGQKAYESSSLNSWGIVARKDGPKGFLKMGQSAILSGIQDAKKLFRKPGAMVYWLLTARWAQIALLVIIFGLPFFMSTVVDTSLEKIYPPVRQEKLLGLISYQRTNPLLEDRQETTRAILWTISIGCFCFLLVLNIPKTILKTTAIAQKRESEADALKQSRPTERIRIYKSALALATDCEQEIRLIRKIKNLEKEILGAENNADNDLQTHKIISKGRTVKLERNSAPPDRRLGEKLSANPARTGDAVEEAKPENRYIILHELGRGAMGVVYLGHDRILARDVALKKLPDQFNQDKDTIERFKQEAVALARLSHPNIVQVYDFVQEDDQAWIAMELVQGKDLDKHLGDSAPLPLKETVQLAIQMAEALAYAHKRGVIHRDFKPANVIVSPEVSAKITDFGLAKLARSGIHTQIGSIMGTPAYMSPEQAQGKVVDSRSDIYAFGVTLYKMLAGRLPFEGDAESIMAQKLTAETTKIPDLEERVPPRLRQMVMQMLNKETDKRPANMEKIAENLRAVAAAPAV